MLKQDMFCILSGIHQVQEVVGWAKSLTGGGVEPWVETAKRVAEKCSVDVKKGEGDLVLDPVPDYIQ